MRLCTLLIIGAAASGTRFFLHEDAKYEATLLGCGARQAKSDAQPWRAAQLANPVANDPRGGVSAELQFCRAARRDGNRTRDASEARVFFLCLHFHLNELVGDCDGAGPIDRLAAFFARIKSGPGYRARKPHVLFGAAEYARHSHSVHGSPFAGARFIYMAAQSHWYDVGGGGRGPGSHIRIPYATAPVASTLEMRRLAEAEAASGAPRPRLLYFKGTGDFGGARARLTRLDAFDRVDYSLRKAGANGGHTAFEQDVVGAGTGAYAASLANATFCLIVSGHTCTTRRLYDAVAAGCLPVYVDCRHEPRVFETTVDHAAFSLFFPLTKKLDKFKPFVECLGRLEADRSFLRKARRALLAAADALTYARFEDSEAAVGPLLDALQPTRLVGHLASAAARGEPTPRKTTKKLRSMKLCKDIKGL
mmetsp:Transcript_16577/g.49500  ORF Transcript_16577/g.49500 Transcript_16577/m.49500 type:complete len:421 (+) Transcript_16577:7-1269(+)